MNLSLIKEYDSEGNLTYDNKDFNLRTSGKQTDTVLGYGQTLESGITYKLRTAYSKQKGHSTDAKDGFIAFFGLGNDELKFGLEYNKAENTKQAEFKYEFKF